MTHGPSEEMTRAVLAAAMDVAVERGWSRTAMTDVAKAAGVSLADMYRWFPDRSAILAALTHLVDQQVLAGPGPDPTERPRDRLFDVLMRRFDALTPYKHGLRVIAQENLVQVGQSADILTQLPRSMAWMLDAADVRRRGPAGVVQATGLAVVWVAALRVWLGDDSADQAKTMASLDANLRRAEELWLTVFPRRSEGGEGDRASSEMGSA